MTSARPASAPTRGAALHLYALTPIHVAPGELARRQARYDARSPAGLTVELRDLGDGAPRALATEQQVRDSEGLVVAAGAGARPRRCADA